MIRCAVEINIHSQLRAATCVLSLICMLGACSLIFEVEKACSRVDDSVPTVKAVGKVFSSPPNDGVASSR